MSRIIAFLLEELDAGILMLACYYVHGLVYMTVDIWVKDEFEQNALYYLCASKSEDSISVAFDIFKDR